jgi:hypothetical protein
LEGGVAGGYGSGELLGLGDVEGDGGGGYGYAGDGVGEYFAVCFVIQSVAGGIAEFVVGLNFDGADAWGNGGN